MCRDTHLFYSFLLCCVVICVAACNVLVCKCVCISVRLLIQGWLLYFFYHFFKDESAAASVIMDQRICSSECVCANVGNEVNHLNLFFFNSEEKYVIKYVRQNEAHVFRCLDSHVQVLIDIYLVSYITDHMAPHSRWQ
jgi:hypothetical protein